MIIFLTRYTKDGAHRYLKTCIIYFYLILNREWNILMVCFFFLFIHYLLFLRYILHYLKVFWDSFVIIDFDFDSCHFVSYHEKKNYNPSKQKKKTNKNTILSIHIFLKLNSINLDFDSCHFDSYRKKIKPRLQYFSFNIKKKSEAIIINIINNAFY